MWKNKTNVGFSKKLNLSAPTCKGNGSSRSSAYQILKNIWSCLTTVNRKSDTHCLGCDLDLRNVSEKDFLVIAMFWEYILNLHSLLIQKVLEKLLFLSTTVSVSTAWLLVWLTLWRWIAAFMSHQCNKK